ncbi:hypothetical protein [Thermobifida alba]|uniref:hypothetical protein n=1 Tax=Thermobifida alba TaxID=53522 RepID=UPI0020C0384D|nr:hypothetical protein [Thermobifida alba]
MLVVGGVVIVVLVVAIVLVFTLGGSGSGGTPTADSPRPQESTSDRTPEDDASTPDVLGDDSDWIPDDIPDDVPEAPGGGLAAGEFPEDMDGDWKGTMTQYGLDGTFQSTWVLDVHMAAGESTGSAELSLENDRSCQWDIITTGNTEDTVDLEYHTTDDGNGSCTPFGYLHFIVDGDNLYVGVASEQPDGSLSTADGVLTRY